MPFTLNQALEQVRRELGDTDAANARWSADDLEQHLRHALEAVSLVLPREERAELLTTAGSTRGEHPDAGGPHCRGSGGVPCR